MRHKYLFYSLILVSMVSLVSGFSFADLFDIEFLTGMVSLNKDPSVYLGMPSDTQVVNNPVTFSWTYFDPEGDTLESYAIYIDDSRRFTSPTAYYGISGESKKIFLDLEDGQYYWRVEVNNKFGSATSEFRSFYLNNKAKVCDDGSAYYKCSLEKPKYCQAGRLIDDCIKCGCSRGAVCGKDGKCIEQKCNDNTIYGECSVDKPRFCLTSGELKDICSLCGCSDGLECGADGNCYEKTTFEDEVILIDVEEQKTGFSGFLSRIAAIFKYLFKGNPL